MSVKIIQGRRCPNCGSESLTYNGNYFCLDCDWVNTEIDTSYEEDSDFILDLMLAYMMQTFDEKNPQPNYVSSMTNIRAELTRRLS